MMVQAPIADTLCDLRRKVEAEEPLTFEDGVRLFETGDIHTLGELANTVRERLHGRNAFYNVNLHVNYTNFCVLRCKFCSFYRPYPSGRSDEATERRSDEGTSSEPRGFSPRERPTGEGSRDQGIKGSRERRSDKGKDGGYELSLDEIVRRVAGAYARGATEVHIVGGLHPKLPFSYYTDMCSAIRTACPHLHIKAFTAIEIIHFTRVCRPRRSIAEVLIQLREAGLGSLPGGGAEIFDDRVHDEAFKTKVGEAEWFEVHRTAHELGIFTNATMLYGHVETIPERVDHMLRLRAQQDETGGFQAFIPLAFHPANTELADLSRTTGYDDLKTLAIGRLLLDDFDHVKSFWIMVGPKIAQLSLFFGVDDLDGTVVEEKITHAAGAETPEAMAREDLVALIQEAGYTAVERDTLYNVVRVEE